MSRAPRRRRLLALGAAAALATGCITPPAVMAAGRRDFAGVVLPPGSEIAQVRLAGGETLRGVWVPAGSDAPVVLHLLDATCSATFGCQLFDRAARRSGLPVLWDLQDLGFASLVLDYRGVGASDGAGSVTHLAADAQAMYAEAVRRAGGDERRVLLRSRSLGSIAAAGLVRAGARPAQWTLIAPVEARTVVGNVIAAWATTPVSWLVSWLVQPVADVPVAATLAAAPCPVLLLQPKPDVDGFTTPAEIEAFAAAARRAHGRVARVGTGHIDSTWHTAGLHAAERIVLRDLALHPRPEAARVARALADTGASLDGRALLRLQALLAVVDAEPAMAVAAAASRVPMDSLTTWCLWLQRLPAPWRQCRTRAEWDQLFDLDDASGPLRPDLIADLAVWSTVRAWHLGPQATEPLLAMLRGDIDDVREFAVAWSAGDRPWGGSDLAGKLLAGGGAHLLTTHPADVERRLATSLARAAGRLRPTTQPDAQALPIGETASPGSVACEQPHAWSPLASLGADELVELFLAELSPGSRAALAGDDAARAWLRRELRERPDYIAVPELLAAWLRDPVHQGVWLPADYVRLHAPRLQRMPVAAQRELALVWSRSGMAPLLRGMHDTDALRADLRELVCVAVDRRDAGLRWPAVAAVFLQLEQGAVDAPNRGARNLLALAGLPSRLDGTDGTVIEVWWQDGWIPWRGPLP